MSDNRATNQLGIHTCKVDIVCPLDPIDGLQSFSHNIRTPLKINATV